MTRRIVLADDHPFIRSGVESVLRGTEFEIVAMAANGAEALARICEHEPDIAIVDIRMPEGGGIEVLRAIRERGMDCAVVLLTADLEDDALLGALDLAADGIVLKEGGENHLLDCLRTVSAGQRWLPDELLARAAQVREQRANSPFRRLTPREAEMVWMVGHNLRNREIAERFGMSEGAVKFALHSIFRKLQVTTRTELALLLQRYRPG